MRVSRYIQYFVRRSTDAWRLPQDRQIDRQTARRAIATFYMPNISYRVVEAQRRLLQAFSPPDIAIEQVITMEKHGAAMDRFMRTTNYQSILFLDIDCVPVRPRSIEAMFERAERGCLAGAAGRANHIDNNAHLFAAPYCLALTRTTYNSLGRPSFLETSRGDVGEELTYIAEERGVPVDLSWPIASDDNQWALTDGVRFGLNTYYDNGFFHAFHIRKRFHQTEFIARCAEILGGPAAAAGVVAEPV